MNDQSTYSVLSPGEQRDEYGTRPCDFQGHDFLLDEQPNGDSTWHCTRCGYKAIECPHSPAHLYLPED